MFHVYGVTPRSAAFYFRFNICLTAGVCRVESEDQLILRFHVN